MDMRLMRILAVALTPVFVLAAGVGCDRLGRDVSELRDPLIRQAHARLREGDKEMALAILKRAIARKPELAQAHLDAALLFDEYKKDYVSAIYHYNRYLELRPKAEKRSMIEDLMRTARMAYAAELVDQEVKLDHRIRQLQEENARLQQELRELRAQTTAASTPTGAITAAASIATAPAGGAPAATATAVTAAAPTPATPAGKNGEYVVQSRDTLSVIAAKVYQDPRKWRVIYEANRDVLPDPSKLSVGMRLRVPAASTAAN